MMGVLSSKWTVLTVHPSLEQNQPHRCPEGHKNKLRVGLAARELEKIDAHSDTFIMSLIGSRGSLQHHSLSSDSRPKTQVRKRRGIRHATRRGELQRQQSLRACVWRGSGGTDLPPSQREVVRGSLLGELRVLGHMTKASGPVCVPSCTTVPFRTKTSGVVPICRWC